MRRIDILTPGREQIAARMAIMAALPPDGAKVCYPRLALAAGACEDAGPIVGQLIDAGMIATSNDGGVATYSRILH